MTYILRRPNDGFPDQPLLLEGNIWYNIWEIRSRPYLDIKINDIILIKVNETLFFEAKLKTLIKNEFVCRDGLMNILHSFGYYPYNGDPYWEDSLSVQSGYLFAYKFKNIKPKRIPPAQNQITWFGNGWGILRNP